MGKAARPRRAVRALCGAWLAGLAALVAGPAAAADLPAPPRVHFDDRAGLVSSAEATRFAAALAGFERRTGIQFVVTVLPSLDGDLADYVNRLYEAWGVGARATNRGVLLAVFPAEGLVRLEPGYGLEETLPDAVANRILDGMFALPREPAAARFAYAIQNVARAVAPDDPLAQGRLPVTTRGRRGSDGLPWPMLLFFLFMLLGGGRARRNWLGPLVIASALNNRRGGGFGGFSGGGFSGGGGLSGGGGASGRW
mgnify:CR=1 FL=1